MEYVFFKNNFLFAAICVFRVVFFFCLSVGAASAAQDTKPSG